MRRHSVSLYSSKIISRADTTATDEENLGVVEGSEASSQEFSWTDEEEKIVRRKLDYYIVPVTTFLYLLCFLDR